MRTSTNRLFILSLVAATAATLFGLVSIFREPIHDLLGSSRSWTEAANVDVAPTPLAPPAMPAPSAEPADVDVRLPPDTTTPPDENLSAREPAADVPAVNPPIPDEPTSSPLPIAPEAVAALPPSYDLHVPMVYQAPFQYWDTLHDEACEEAAMLMLRWYLDGRTEVSREEMDEEIMRLTAYERGLGYGWSINAEQMVDIMANTLSITNAQILPVTESDDLRRHIAAGRPVLLPAYGRGLNNPNFRNGGPIYHAIVVKGYTADGYFITHDPGTRHGANYLYPAETLFNAIHDWNGGDVLNGDRVVIVVN